jgi:cytochrome c oxidase subunit IV
MKKPQLADSYNSINKLSMTDLKVILFGGRRWMITTGLIVSAVMFMNWDWLVSIGAASIILAVAPCLIMCSLGLCMNKSGCQKKKAPEDTDT